MKPEIVTFWHGSPLHGIHRMCLASQVRLGYPVTLYSYEPMPGLPDGVRNEDAAAVLPLRTLDRLQPARWRGPTNHPILHLSDLFRFRLQRLGRGLWLDTDICLIRPFEIDAAQPFFAWESRKYIGNAVLYLPSEHPITNDFDDFVSSGTLMPDWLPLRLRARKTWWDLTGREHGPQDLSTIVFGPLAVTQLAKRHDSLGAALPRRSFYEFARTHGFFEPSDVERVVNDPGVFGIHVQRKARWDQPPVPGSMYEWALRNVTGSGRW